MRALPHDLRHRRVYGKLASYFKHPWRKNQLSDHYPIWVELVIDSADPARDAARSPRRHGAYLASHASRSPWARETPTKPAMTMVSSGLEATPMARSSVPPGPSWMWVQSAMPSLV